MSQEREPATAEHVILMRRAATDRSFKGDERDRPLSAAGQAAVRLAAQAIFGEGHHPGPLLASTALAARQTEQLVAEELRIPAGDVFISDLLYDASGDVMEAQLRVQAVAYTLVTLIADNPGISDLARFLASDPKAPSLQPGEWRYLRWPPPP
ncbi:MAG TPA: hypothetical protein VMH77_09330 [Steroidobacteraceae bacterium]|nr:hypothetical protein [Steroidobacteraceae bacterium]